MHAPTPPILYLSQVKNKQSKMSGNHKSWIPKNRGRQVVTSTYIVTRNVVLLSVGLKQMTNKKFWLFSYANYKFSFLVEVSWWCSNY